MSRAITLICLLGIATAGFADEEAKVAKILSSLDDETTLDFFEAPLGEVVDYLKDLHNIPIYIDSAALKKIGTGTDTPVTQSLKNVSLRSGLNLMLGELGLTYAIHNEVLGITSPERARDCARTAVYPIGDLATDERSQESLLKIIRPFVTKRKGTEPNKADHEDNSLVVFGDHLIATTTEQEQYKIQTVMKKLRGTTANVARAQTKPMLRERSRARLKSAKTDPFADSPRPTKDKKVSADPFDDTVGPGPSPRKRDTDDDPFGYGKGRSKKENGNSKQPTKDPFGTDKQDPFAQDPPRAVENGDPFGN